MTSNPIRQEASRELRILLVDDQRIVAEGLKRQLAGQENLSLFFCQSGEVALKEIERTRPTIILQDLVLPDTNGIELLKLYRSHPLSRDIPVMMLSTTEDARTKFEAFEAGANDYVVKFPETFELLGRVRCHSNAYHTLLERNRAEEERFRIVQELGQRSQLESMGRLAAGLAHEINTPCQYMRDNLDFVRSQLEAVLSISTHQTKNADAEFLQKEIPKALADSLEGIEQISLIVKAMSVFTQSTTTEKQTEDLRELLQRALVLTRNAYRDRIEVTTSIDQDCQLLSCSGPEIVQALTHLLMNAIEAIDRRAPEATKSRGAIHIAITAEEGQLILTLQDNGCGIEPEIQPYLFEPFSSSRRAGAKYGGQGLSIAKAIVCGRHGGQITFQTVLGGGTTFRIALPR